MFKGNNRNGKILNVLLGLIALFIIIFIIAWVVNKGSNTANYDVIYKTNLNTMQEKAKEHFASELPEEIGDTTKLTLKEMYRLNLVTEFTYGKTSCDTEKSYISITKINETEYKVKSTLVCGDKTDNITEKIETKTVVDDENGNNIIDGENPDTNLDIEQGTTDKENDKVTCSGVICSFEEVETTCETKYEYEYVKRNVSCASGYSYQNGTCLKETTLTTNPTLVYSQEKLIIENALVNKGQSYNQYTDPIVTGGEKYSFCTQGQLINGYCYTYADKNTETTTSCPNGYKEVNGACYKYADYNTSTSTTCPNGYQEKNGACYKYADIITTSNETYTCPNGYEKVGSGKSTKCLKVVTAVKKYTEWGNPDGIYSSTQKETTYEYELEKKVEVGSNTILGTTVYSYAIYTRKSSYYCAQGSYDKSTNKCNIYLNPTVNGSSTTSCPKGYTKDGNTCYIKKDLTTSTSKTCPNGYTEGNNTCYVKTDLIKDTLTTCPKGYTDNGQNCYTRTLAKTGTTKKEYTCPNGYNTKGSGENLECYKTYFDKDNYYCENANATLKDNKCYLTVKAELIGSTCPKGYDASGNTCVKVSTETSAPIWTNGETIYSPATSLEGYQKTGVAKFVTTCTPVKHYK